MENNLQLSINNRIKDVRAALRLTQVQCSRILSMSTGYLAGIEVSKRKVNDRFVKLMCSAFNVNETWLRTGEGEMFSTGPSEQYVKLSNLFHELNPTFQEYIIKQVDLLLAIQDGK
jgi:transcriptional regulator with XRE-family HTH domain